MKKYIIISFLFMVLGIACGVFYREFSKAYEVVNTYTTLGVAHSHFLVLGSILTLVIGLVTIKVDKSNSILFNTSLIVFVVGVLGSGLMLLTRGIFDVLDKSALIEYNIPKPINGILSGVSGCFHAVLGVGVVLIFTSWLLKNKSEKTIK